MHFFNPSDISMIDYHFKNVVPLHHVSYTVRRCLPAFPMSKCTYKQNAALNEVNLSAHNRVFYK